MPIRCSRKKSCARCEKRTLSNERKTCNAVCVLKNVPYPVNAKRAKFAFREDELAARRIEDIDDIDSVEDVKGRELTITVSVHSASNLPEKSCRHPQVRLIIVDISTDNSCNH